MLLCLVLELINPGRIFSQDVPRKTVLVISSGDPDRPVYWSNLEGVRESCDELYPGSVEIFREFIDLIRIEEPEYVNSLPELYRKKYASRKIDAIIASGPGIDEFVSRHAGSIFPGVPVLFGPGKEPAGQRFHRFEECIELILHLQPAVKKLFVIIGSHSIDEQFKVLVKDCEKLFPSLEFVYLQGLSLNELMRAVGELPKSSAIFFGSFFKDRNGLSLTIPVVAGKVSESAGCPVYGMNGLMMGKGIVGGPLVDYRQTGRIMGHHLLKILFGDDALKGTSPVEMSVFKQVDERQMVRWRLSESDLPPGYEVVNRSPSIWRDHRYEIMLVFVFLFLETTLIISLLSERRRKRTAEKKLLEAMDVLKENREELKSTLDSKSMVLEHLKEKEATLEAIVSSIPVGVVIVERGTGIIRQANRAAGDMFGRTPEEMIGQPCRTYCKSCWLMTEKAGEECLKSFENWIAGEEDRETCVLQTVADLTLRGKPHLVECFLDITDRKLAAKKAREHEAQLVHADRMISLGTMAAGVAHEISNPNNFISTNAPVLKMAWDGLLERLDEYAAEHGDFPVGQLPYSKARERIPALLRGIMEGSERIRNIVRDMKEFSTPKSPGMDEMVSINSALETSLKLLANTLYKSALNVKVEYGEDIPPIKGNSQRVEQVVVNLILNAVQALSGSRKVISIKTAFAPDAQRAILEVRDEGEGIEPANLKRIFDPFFTTKRETGGTGLGLAISLNIARAHGGEILIDSRQGEGTVARLEIPAFFKKGVNEKHGYPA